MWEWNDQVIFGTRGLRGGSWSNGMQNRQRRTAARPWQSNGVKMQAADPGGLTVAKGVLPTSRVCRILFSSMGVTEIKDLALSLEGEDREELAALLVHSLDSADPHDSDEDSLTEARRRSEEISSGKVVPLSEDVFWDGVRNDRGK